MIIGFDENGKFHEVKRKKQKRKFIKEEFSANMAPLLHIYPTGNGTSVGNPSYNTLPEPS